MAPAQAHRSDAELKRKQRLKSSGQRIGKLGRAFVFERAYGIREYAFMHSRRVNSVDIFDLVPERIYR